MFEDNLNKKEQGIFTKVDVLKDTVMLEFKGDLFDTTTLSKIEYYLQIGDNKFLGASGYLDDYVAHSCSPNCFIRIVGNRAFLVSLYSIKAGTQITFDYSTTSTETLEEWKMNCNCGDYNCRKIISGYKSLDQIVKDNYETMGIIPDYVKG